VERSPAPESVRRQAAQGLRANAMHHESERQEDERTCTCLCLMPVSASKSMPGRADLKNDSTVWGLPAPTTHGTCEPPASSTSKRGRERRRTGFNVGFARRLQDLIVHFGVAVILFVLLFVFGGRRRHRRSVRRSGRVGRVRGAGGGRGGGGRSRGGGAECTCVAAAPTTTARGTDRSGAFARRTVGGRQSAVEPVEAPRHHSHGQSVDTWDCAQNRVPDWQKHIRLICTAHRHKPQNHTRV
jgi:hypothetical protein